MLHNNACHRPALANVKTGMFSRTTDCVIMPQQSIASTQPLADVSCDTTVPLRRSPGGTVPCGNMITTSIDEGVELDMASEQPTLSRIPGVYNNSNVVDGMPGNLPSRSECGSGVLPSNVFGDLSQMASVTTSNQSISTGIGSAFTSFDSNTEADLMLGHSSASVTYTCGGIVAPTAGPQMFGTATTTPPITSKFGHTPDGALGCTDVLDDRVQTHSPIHFREGRRASDGLMTQGIIVFKQRLKESMKTRGVAELQKEIGNLHHRCDMTCTIEELQALQEQHPCLIDSITKTARQWSLNEGSLLATATERPKLTVKRKSLPSPGQMDMIPPAYRLMHLNKCSLEGGSSPPVTTEGSSEPAFGGVYTSSGFVVSDYQNASPVTSSAKSLQQQLLHHRLQQKRQIFQKQSQQPLLHHHQLFQQFQAMHIDSSQAQVIHEEDTTLPSKTTNGHLACVASQNCLPSNLATGQESALPPGVHLMQFQHASMCNCLTAANKDRTQPVCNNSGVAPKPSLATFRQMSYKLAQQHPVAPQFRADEPWQQPQLSAEQPLSTMFEEGAESDGLIGPVPYDRSGNASEHSLDETATSMDTC